jgi:hypothetical protein
MNEFEPGIGERDLKMGATVLVAIALLAIILSIVG